jgi:hypothetical protein
VEQVPARAALLPDRGAPRRVGATSRCSGARPRSSSRTPLVGAGLAAAPPAAHKPPRHAGIASRPAPGLADALH